MVSSTLVIFEPSFSTLHFTFSFPASPPATLFAITAGISSLLQRRTIHQPIMAEASPPPLLQRPALLRSFAPLDYKGILRHLGIIVVFTLLLPFLLLSLILYA